METSDESQTAEIHKATHIETLMRNTTAFELLEAITWPNVNHGQGHPNGYAIAFIIEFKVLFSVRRRTNNVVIRNKLLMDNLIQMITRNDYVRIGFFSHKADYDIENGPFERVINMLLAKGVHPNKLVCCWGPNGHITRESILASRSITCEGPQSFQSELIFDVQSLTDALYVSQYDAPTSFPFIIQHSEHHFSYTEDADDYSPSYTAPAPWRASNLIGAERCLTIGLGYLFPDTTITDVRALVDYLFNIVRQVHDEFNEYIRTKSDQPEYATHADHCAALAKLLLDADVPDRTVFPDRKPHCGRANDVGTSIPDSDGRVYHFEVRHGFQHVNPKPVAPDMLTEYASRFNYFPPPTAAPVDDTTDDNAPEAEVVVIANHDAAPPLRLDDDNTAKPPPALPPPTDPAVESSADLDPPPIFDGHNHVLTHPSTIGDEQPTWSDICSEYQGYTHPQHPKQTLYQAPIGQYSPLGLIPHNPPNFPLTERPWYLAFGQAGQYNAHPCTNPNCLKPALFDHSTKAFQHCCSVTCFTAAKDTGIIVKDHQADEAVIDFRKYNEHLLRVAIKRAGDVYYHFYDHTFFSTPDHREISVNPQLCSLLLGYFSQTGIIADYNTYIARTCPSMAFSGTITITFGSSFYGFPRTDVVSRLKTIHYEPGDRITFCSLRDDYSSPAEATQCMSELLFHHLPELLEQAPGLNARMIKEFNDRRIHPDFTVTKSLAKRRRHI